MKSITNYLNAPSCIYKSFTKGAVILTNIICILMCLVAAMAESHPIATLAITSLIGIIVFLTKTTTKQKDSGL